MNISIKPASNHDLNEVSQWLLGSNSLDNQGPYSSGVIDLNNPNNGWGGWSDGELVAFASLVLESGNTARIGFIVKPSRRREGIAKNFVPALLRLENLGSFTRIVGTPTFEDTAAQKVLATAGFHRLGTDSEGLPIYEKR